MHRWQISWIIFAAPALGLVGCSESATPVEQRRLSRLEPVELRAHPLGGTHGPLVVSSPMVIVARARGAEPPGEGAYVAVMDKPKNREPAAHQTAIGHWLPSTVPGEWEFEVEVRGPKYPGEYTLVVRYGPEVLDEAPITVSAAAE